MELLFGSDEDCEERSVPYALEFDRQCSPRLEVEDGLEVLGVVGL